MMFTPGCGCCGCANTICVQVNGCSGGISGASVTVTAPGGKTFTGTTGGTGQVCISVKGTTGNYSVSVTSGGFSGSSTVNVTGCAATYNTTISFITQTCIKVTGCNGAISGATVSGNGKTCTTDATGQCCLQWTANPPANISVTVSIPSGPSQTATVGGTCATTTFNFIDKMCFTVYGCNSLPLSGASVTIGTYSCTTGANGQCCVTPTTDLTGQTLAISVTATHFNSYSGSSVAGCGMGQTTLTPATGYTCCGGCAVPIKTSWTITDANGSHAITLGGAVACYQASANNVYQNAFTTCDKQGAPGTIDIMYQLTCGTDVNGNPTLTLAMWVCMTMCNDGSLNPPCYYYNTLTSNCVTTSCNGISDKTNMGANLVGTYNCAAPTLSGTFPTTASFPCPINNVSQTFPLPALGTVTVS